MRILPLCFVALATAGCMKIAEMHPQPIIDEHPYDAAGMKEMTQLVINYSVELEHTLQMELENSRVFFDEKIQKLRLDFSSQNIVDLCKARAQLVDITDGYLNRINSDAIVKRNLAHYPFAPEDIEIHITYGSDFVTHVDPTYTSAAILENGIAYFYNGELEEPQSDIWKQRIEPYEKTQQFVRFRREARRPILEAIEQQRRETLLKEERFID